MRKTDALIYAGSAATAIVCIYFLATESWRSALPYGVLTLAGLALAAANLPRAK